jgi:hypothetical protein
MKKIETMSDSEMRACLDHPCMEEALNSGTVDFRSALWEWDHSRHWWVKIASYAASQSDASDEPAR